MQITAILVAVGLASFGSGVTTARQSAAPRRSGTGPATLAIMVTDAAGKPLTGVRVALQGPTVRESSTEQGRLVFEGLPTGNYKLTFEQDGYEKGEKDVTARGSSPIDVKISLTPVAAAPPPPASTPELKPVAPVVDAQPVTIDMPSFIERNFIGRSSGKTTVLACAPGGEATLLQIREPVQQHVHDAADEYLYVIAGEGTAHTGKIEQPLHAGVFMLVPRGVPHALTASGRSPLMVISVKAGEKCAPGGVQ